MVRLRFLEFSRDHPVSVTSRHFGISRSTFYRWKKRYQPFNLKSLENRSRRPKNLRRNRWSLEEIERVRELREKYPSWGKAKLVILLQGEGFQLSESKVGRIVSYLKKRGVLREPVKSCHLRRVPHKRVYATRKPRDYRPQSPGDLLEIDTVDIRFPGGLSFKGFAAWDSVSRYGFTDLSNSLTSKRAQEFLEHLIRDSPFPIRAIQTDQGSEFCGEFELACQRLGILFFCLPPRSPKLNGGVERFHRIVQEEFWAFYEGEEDLMKMREVLRNWTKEVYNGKRPHQGLGYLTPADFLSKFRGQGVSHVVN
jgi:transposase InsO family protein